MKKFLAIVAATVFAVSAAAQEDQQEADQPEAPGEQVPEFEFASPECEAFFYELQYRMTEMDLSYEELQDIKEYRDDAISDATVHGMAVPVGLKAWHAWRDEFKQLQAAHKANPAVTTGGKWAQRVARYSRGAGVGAGISAFTYGVLGLISDTTIGIVYYDEAQLKEDVDLYINQCLAQ